MNTEEAKRVLEAALICASGPIPVNEMRALFDGEVGGAYRPLGRSSLYLLGVVRFKVDRKGSSPTGDGTRSLISSIEMSRRVRPYLTLDGKYAAKMSWETMSDRQFQSFSDMVLAGGTYDLTDCWDVSLHAKLMNQYQTAMSSIGMIAQVSYRIYKNVKVGVGYNFSRLNDKDLAGEGYQAGGPFIDLKFKFDETTIEGLYQKITSGPMRAESAPPPPPAPKLLSVILKAALIEEPIEILGSAEALSLLINDREAAFPQGNITVKGEAVDEVIDVKGGELDRPLEFQIETSTPEKIASWTLALSTIQGDVLRVIDGKGAPKPIVSWDGRTDRNEMLKGGEIYQYRLEVEFSDGSRVASPFRLFGLNRTTAVAMSLTGGAFETGSSVLSREARKVLKQTALVLCKYPNEKIIVEGHTDSVGQDVTNLELSRKRSQAAADYLINEEKIPAERIVVRWFGKNRPVASNAIAEGRELNRRVEVKGEFSDTKRPIIMDRHRVAPFVSINRLPVKVDESGRFSKILTEKVERIEIEMGDSQGRAVQSSLTLPNLILLEPAGGEARIVCSGNDGDSCGETTGAPKLRISYKFIGKAVPGGSLTLNGKDIAVAADGTFTFLLDLGEGDITYWLLVRNPEGFGRHVRLNVSVDREKSEMTAKDQGAIKPPVLLPLSPRPVPGMAGPAAAVNIVDSAGKRAEAPKSDSSRPEESVAMDGLQVRPPDSTRKIVEKHEATPSGETVTTKMPSVATDRAETVSKSDKKYVVVVGEYLGMAAVTGVEAKVKKIGLIPKIQPGPHRDMSMIRLLVNESTDHESAKRMLVRLRTAKVAGFMLVIDRRYHVYAGSYSSPEDAAKEQKRLAGLGITVHPKKATVSMPIFQLVAGDFPTREAALDAALKLEKLRIKPLVAEID